MKRTKSLLVSTLLILSLAAVGVGAFAGTAVALDAELTAEPSTEDLESEHNASAVVESSDDVEGDLITQLQVNYSTFNEANGDISGVSDNTDIVELTINETTLTEAQDIDNAISTVNIEDNNYLQFNFDVDDENVNNVTEGNKVEVVYEPVTNAEEGTYDDEITLTNETNDEDSGEYDLTIDAHTRDITDNNDDVVFDDEAAEVNVTFDYTAGVNQSTINVSVENTDTNEVTQVVEDGEIVNGSGDIVNGDSVDVEVGDLELQEGDYDIYASAEDEEGTEESLDADTFDVDMEADSLDLIEDPTGPLAGTNATIGVVALDRFDNQLTDAQSEGEIDSTAGDLSINTDPSQSDEDVEVFETFEDGDDLVFDTGADELNVTFNATYNVAGALSIEAFDTGDAELGSASIDQTYTAEVSDIEVTADSETLVADGQDTINITAQILDQNDNPIERSGEDIDWSTGNRDVAGIQGHEDSQTTDGEGTVTQTLTADTAGFEVSYTGIHGPSDSNDAVSFETVPGEVDDLTLFLNGEDVTSTTVDDVKVGTEHDVAAFAEDTSGNAIAGTPVDYEALFDDSVVFEETVDTNEDGFANTTFTLPEEKGTTTLNATANGASAEFDVETDADDITAVEFVSDARVVPVGDSLEVEVGTVDQFGNVNETGDNEVDVLTSDADVVSVNDGEEDTLTLSDGSETFTAGAEDSEGSADITLVPDDFENVTETFTVGQPAAIEAEFDLDFVTSQENVDGAENSSEITAQLVDEDGNDFEVDGVNVSFTRQDGNSLPRDGDLVQQTDGDGVASVDYEVVDDRTGPTTVRARSGEFDIRDSDTVTASGEVDAIEFDPEEEVADVGDEVNTTVWFIDDEDRPVAVSDEISIDVDGEPGALIDEDGNQTDDVDVTTEKDNGLFTAQITVTSDEEGDVSLFAAGQEIGQDAQDLITFEEEDIPEPEVEDAGQPTDVSIEEGVQDQLVEDLSFVGFDEGQDGVDVFVDVSSLADNGVDLDSLDVDEDAVESTSATAVDANAESGDQYVRYTFDIDENETSFTVEDLPVQDIDASDANATENLTHEVSFTDDFDAAVETGEYDIVEEDIALFTEPLIPDFENPPTNTQKLDDELYEDLSGDGDGTDVSQTVDVFGELIRDEEALDDLTDEQSEALAWDDDSPADQVTIGDMVELFGEQIRA